MSTAIVIASGSPPLTSQLPSMSGDELIVAVDGGLSATRALGFVPTVVLGDLDSAQREDLDWADSIGVDYHKTGFAKGLPPWVQRQCAKL